MRDEDRDEMWRREQVKRFEEWDNSLEGVMYQLITIGDTLVCDEEDKLLIAKTLLRLPKEVRDEVLQEVVFVHYQAYGTVVNFHQTGAVDLESTKQIADKTYYSADQPLVLLNFGLMRNEGASESEMMDTIAHELAHFVLRHHTIEKCSVPHGHGEREADDLIEKWGFKRVYTSYEEFEWRK